MKMYSIVYCYIGFSPKGKRVPIWNEIELEAEGIYEVSELFFNLPSIKEVYPDIKQVQFRHKECCGQ